MTGRLLILAALIGAAYWYWTGPYQAKINPDYDAVLKQNARDMGECMRTAAYKLGATGSGVNAELAEQQCAEKFNLYQVDGQWHSYDMARPGQ